MSDAPWLKDTVSLVDAFRAKEISPLEALDASLAAIDASQLNAFSHIAADEARAAAAVADVNLPLGGVPIGIKELDPVNGWPQTDASLVFKDRVASYDATVVSRLREAGAVLVGLTTASEFGGINVTSTRLNGVTRNPWDLERNPGGSSGGSAAAVSGGLVPIASGGDGGGSIRIPAALTGLFGLKCTYGRVPKSPNMLVQPLTAVLGCMARSVRDAARWIDNVNGFDPRDPYSLPRVEGWEAGLGSVDTAGLRAAVILDFGGAVVLPAAADLVAESAGMLIAEAGLKQVDVTANIPETTVGWALAGAVSLLAELGTAYPDCAGDLTPEIAFILQLASDYFNLRQAADVEHQRMLVNEAMAAVFDETDLVITLSYPDVAFPADGGMPSKVGDELVNVANNGALTIPANTSGQPGVSIPVGLVDGLPIGMQVMARHHQEPLLLDLSLTMERIRPWPLVAPNAPT